MKPYFSNKSELGNYFNFSPATPADDFRLEKAWGMYISDYKGDGCMGCVAELLTATANSRKSFVSNAGKLDCFILYRTNNGNIIPVGCERKTNGGRIQTIETAYSKAEKLVGRYVVYSLDICNSTTQGLRRHVPAVVIPKALFLAKLQEFGALKEVKHKGMTDGIAIQPSKKEWYNWLMDYPIVYDRNAVYCEEDFEGLD